MEGPQSSEWMLQLDWFSLSSSCTSGFPCGLAGKESTCNAGELGLIPGSGRSAWEGIGYSLQCSWAFLVAQLVKNLPAVWEAWVWSPHWDDPLEKGRATHSSVLAWRIPWAIQSMGSQRIGHDWRTLTFHMFSLYKNSRGFIYSFRSVVNKSLTLCFVCLYWSVVDI